MLPIPNAAREAGEAPDTARDRMTDIAKAMRQEGAEAGAPEMVESLPERLREGLTSKDTLAKLDEVTRDLEKAAAELRASRGGEGAGVLASCLSAKMTNVAATVPALVSFL